VIDETAFRKRLATSMTERCNYDRPGLRIVSTANSAESFQHTPPLEIASIRRPSADRFPRPSPAVSALRARVPAA
jgi:hypothetical protein